MTRSGRSPSTDQGEVAQGFRGTSLGTLAPPTSAAAPLSTHLSGAGGNFSDAGGPPMVDGSLIFFSLTTDLPSLSFCSIYCFVGWEMSSPFYFQKSFSFSFSFSFYFPQKTSADQNSVSQEKGQKTASLRNIPPYGSPDPPRCQVQKVPLRRQNRVPLLPLRYSAVSAKTLLLPFSSPQNTFCTEGLALWEAGAGAWSQRVGIFELSSWRTSGSLKVLFLFFLSGGGGGGGRLGLLAMMPLHLPPKFNFRFSSLVGYRYLFKVIYVFCNNALLLIGGYFGYLTNIDTRTIDN